MARGDAYATIVQYRAANRDAQTAADTTITTILLGTSRLLDRDLAIAEGGFNAYTATHYFGGNGGQLLTLEDTDGFTYFLRTIDANSLAIDSELDGTYDGYLLDLTTDTYIIGQPENSLTKPFTQLRLLPWTAAAITTWPTTPRSVKITGAWGYATVPDLITQLTIRLTRLLVDSHLSGGAEVIPGIDELMRMPEASREVRGVWYSVKKAYGRVLFATSVSI